LNRMEKPLPDGIAILDFGGQYCHLIARRVRELRVYSEILPSDSDASDLEALGGRMKLKGVIISGSPSSVRSERALTLDRSIVDYGLPVLGLCYGLHLLAKSRRLSMSPQVFWRAWTPRNRFG